MPSASSPVSDALAGYVAGRLQVERLVIAVAAAYYREEGRGKREELRPLIEIIDRAAPGIVELGSVESRPGFAVQLAERPFPKQYEAELRRAAQAVLSGGAMRDAGGLEPAAATHLAPRISLRGVASWIWRLLRGSPSA
ncbi:MAG TPA: hypothetical protein VEM13_08465 [Gemmatimonadales bacterium]|nr:hypothetical protein [Gemmatimonadales bacterium]